MQKNRKRLPLALVIVSLVLGATGLLAGIFGFYVNKYSIEPFYDLVERIDQKGRRILRLPTITVSLVESIDTTFFTLKGKSYTIPNNDFQVGGAIASWGDDVLVLHQSGTLHYLDESLGLVDAELTVPDNGRTAYLELAERKYPERRTRWQSIRYNDVEFVESPTVRGLLLSYTFIDTDRECYQSRISYLPIDDSVVSIRDLKVSEEDWELVFQSSPCLEFNPENEMIVGYMAGGRIAFKSPSTLYLGSGEYHLDGIYRPDAGIQSTNSDYGKTIEVDIRTKSSRHYSVGHRNLQGVELDGLGRLWTTEHGMRGGDELNLILDGENYGWPLEDLGTLYSGLPAPNESGPGRHNSFKKPVYAWLPSAAVSSLAYINGFHETWDGDLLIGSLKGRTLYRARIDGDRLVYFETIPIGQRIRDVMQISGKRLALWLDTNELVIFKIEERADPLAGLEERLVAEMSPEMAKDVVETVGSCLECHALQKDIHGAGPSLYGVLGRNIASTAFGGYSTALKSRSGEWDIDTLASYLSEPEVYAEGTGMSGLGLGNLDLAKGVAEALSMFGEQ